MKSITIEEIAKDPSILFLFSNYSIELTEYEQILLNPESTVNERLSAATKWYGQRSRILK